MKTHKKLIITFHNPNNENDSQLIAEDFISHASQKVVKAIIKEQPSVSVEAAIQEALRRL